MSRTLDIYARVSRKGDKEQRSTSGQVAACRAVLAERGLTAGEVHIDDGRSAWNPRVTRPGWEALMLRLASGATDGVIVFDLERFTRQPKEGERLIDAAERGLTVLDSDAENDLTTASGKKAFRDAMAAAAYYSDRLRDRSRRGKRAKAMNGEVDKRRSFGFEADGVTVRDDEANVLRDCARRLLAGEAQEGIIRNLNERGVPSVRGAQWGYTTFRQLMTRPRTAGRIAHKGTVVARLPGEPILDQDTYDRIVALYAARRPGRPPSDRYLLTGLVDCHCGAKLAGRPVTGTPRRHYWCKACRGTSVSVDRLDTHILDWAIRVLSDPAHADAIERAEQALAGKRTLLENEITSRMKVAKEMADRLGRGELDLDEYDAYRKPLREQVDRLKAELAGLDAVESEPITGRTIPERDKRWQTWLEVATEGTVPERRSMVIRALAGRKIVVGSGKPARFDPERVTISAP